MLDWRAGLSRLSAVELVRIRELARRSGVPIATVQHYLREGLIASTRKTGRTMAWYDSTLAPRIRAIKELQQRQFLPLAVIREALGEDAEAPNDLAADAIARVLARHGGNRARTRAEVIARGAHARELDLLAAAGLAVPTGDDPPCRTATTRPTEATTSRCCPRSAPRAAPASPPRCSRSTSSTSTLLRSARWSPSSSGCSARA